MGAAPACPSTTPALFTSAVFASPVLSFASRSASAAAREARFSRARCCGVIARISRFSCSTRLSSPSRSDAAASTSPRGTPPPPSSASSFAAAALSSASLFLRVSASRRARSARAASSLATRAFAAKAFFSSKAANAARERVSRLQGVRPGAFAQPSKQPPPPASAARHPPPPSPRRTAPRRAQLRRARRAIVTSSAPRFSRSRASAARSATTAVSTSSRLRRARVAASACCMAKALRFASRSFVSRAKSASYARMDAVSERSASSSCFSRRARDGRARAAPRAPLRCAFRRTTSTSSELQTTSCPTRRSRWCARASRWSFLLLCSGAPPPPKTKTQPWRGPRGTCASRVQPPGASPRAQARAGSSPRPSASRLGVARLGGVALSLSGVARARARARARGRASDARGRTARAPPTEASDPSLLNDAGRPERPATGVLRQRRGEAARSPSAAASAGASSFARATPLRRLPRASATPSAARSRSCVVLDARAPGLAYAPARLLEPQPAFRRRAAARRARRGRQPRRWLERSSALRVRVATASCFGRDAPRSAASDGRFKNGNVRRMTFSLPRLGPKAARSRSPAPSSRAPPRRRIRGARAPPRIWHDVNEPPSPATRRARDLPRRFLSRETLVLSLSLRVGRSSLRLVRRAPRARQRRDERVPRLGRDPRAAAYRGAGLL